MNNLEIKNHRELINTNLKNEIIALIKSENPKSILSKISDNIVFKYLDISSESENIYIYTYKLNQKLIGYAILAKKPKYLISEFNQLKKKIFFDLILKGKILTIFDIIFSILKIDILNIDKKNLDVFNNSLNLNLIAIKKSFQSYGYGSSFLNLIIKDFKDQNEFKHICCETFSDRAENFYIDKFEFETIGKKFRTSGFLKVLKKDFS